MTTKRKLILKAIALSGAPTVDDLVLSTGLQRKNLQDNLKACMSPVQLLERIRDDVTGQPAYKLTKQGREWLENDKDDSSTKQPQAQVGDNSASKDKGSHVVGGGMTTDPLPLGNAVTAPPDQPQKAPVDLVSADVMDLMQRNADLDVRLNSAGKSIVEFCEWLATTAVPHAGKGAMACPMNLAEARMVIKSWAASQKIAQSEVAWRTLTDAHKELGMSERDVFIGIPEKIRDLKTMLHDRQESFSKACAEVRALEDRISVMSCQLDDANNEAARLKSENIALSTLNASMPGFGATFAALKQSDLPAGVTLKTPQPQGYVIRCAGKPATFAMSHENAKSAAMRFARSNGCAQVFALIPAGKAVAGAEWKG